jgi:hypothetical protein
VTKKPTKPKLAVKRIKAWTDPKIQPTRETLERLSAALGPKPAPEPSKKDR